MEDFQREGTDKTPAIFLSGKGKFKLSGTSMPEDTAKFYFAVMDWMSDYFRQPAKNTEIQISLRYINSSSASMIYKIFHFFNRLPSTGRSTVSCHWTYEEDDTQMADYISMIQEVSGDIKFSFVKVDKIEEEEEGAVDNQRS